MPYCDLAMLEALSGHRTGVADPFQQAISGYGQQELQPDQSDAIAAAEALLPGIT